MRSLLIRRPRYTVRCDLISGAILFGWLATTQSCLAQEAPSQSQEKKPAAATEKPGTSGQAVREGMMSQMRGMMGGRMGMGQPAKPAQASEPTLEEMLTNEIGRAHV